MAKRLAWAVSDVKRLQAEKIVERSSRGRKTVAWDFVSAVSPAGLTIACPPAAVMSAPILLGVAGEFSVTAVVNESDGSVINVHDKHFDGNDALTKCAHGIEHGLPPL
jgi:hypothetical protein